MGAWGANLDTCIEKDCSSDPGAGGLEDREPRET